MRSLPCCGVLTLIGLALISSGCRRTPERIHLAPVSGSVLFDKKPLKRATIQFIPEKSDPKKPAPIGKGRTDDEGKYTIFLESGDLGIPPGVYKVTFSRKVLPDGSVADENAPDQANAVEKMPVHLSEAAHAVYRAQVPKAGGVFDWDLPSK